MGHRFLSDLTDRESVNEVYLASQKILRPNRNGQLYLQVQLADRSGSLSALMWNAGENVYQSFAEGEYVRVQGTAQLYQGEMQMIATKIEPVPATAVNPTDFTVQTPDQIDKLVLRLEQILRGLADEHLRALAECYLMDETFMRAFSHVPAGVKNHHAYVGGLLNHVVRLLEVALRVCELYPKLKKDLLLLGVFLHDSGKVQELSYEKGFAYTDEGQLIGHVVLGVGMLERKAAEAERLLGEAVPEDLLLQLRHMIVSHHGSHEFGAPRLPMTLEAVALWQIDNLDAKLQSFEQLMKDDPNTDSPWTLFHANIGRKLYKGLPPGAAAAE